MRTIVLCLLAITVLSGSLPLHAETSIEFEMKGLTHHSIDAQVNSFHGTWKLTSIDTVDCRGGNVTVRCLRTRIANVNFNLNNIKLMQRQFDQMYTGGIPPDILQVPKLMSDEYGRTYAVTPAEEEAVRAFITVVSNQCNDAFRDVITMDDISPVREASEWRIPNTSMELIPVHREYPHGTYEIIFQVSFDSLSDTPPLVIPEP